MSCPPIEMSGKAKRPTRADTGTSKQANQGGYRYYRRCNCSHVLFLHAVSTAIRSDSLSQIQKYFQV